MKLSSFCVEENIIIKEAISVIQNNRSRCIIVLNNKKKVVGTFSEGDVLKAILKEIDLHTPLKKLLKPSFYYLNQRDMLRAYDLVKQHGISLVPVINSDFVLQDVITIFDIMDHLVFVNNKK
ncbi:MAG: CBS domain-containing protein [Candidatus Omnitrophica bacterium]|nr:CBS domain-containing protein [Candidatus Omnitrophota bacterium]